MFNPDNLKDIRKAINTALDPIAQEFSIKFDLGDISYESDGSNFSTKLQGSIVHKSGFPMNKEALAFKRYEVGIQIGHDLFDTFKHGGEEFVIIGYKPRAKKSIVLHNVSRNRKQVAPKEFFKMRMF